MEIEEMQKKIDRNRDIIERFLSVDLPIDIIYLNIRTLAKQNERLIEKIKLLENGNKEI